MNIRRAPQKGLPRFRYRNAEEELGDARTSVRYWWFQYLRLSKDYWLISQTHGRTLDRNLFTIWQKFGDVHNTTFDDWWLKTGSYRFREQTEPPDVLLIKNDLSNLKQLDETRALIEVPLVLRRETVQRKIRKLLATIDFDRPRNILETSKSEFPINPVAFRLNVLQKMHEVWCAHRELIAKPIHLKQFEGTSELNEQKRNDLFELGKRLNLSPSNALLHDDYNILKKRQNGMRATVSRYIRRANQLIYNVEYGRFPMFNSPPPNLQNRFTDRQREAHKELELQWWTLDLTARFDTKTVG